MRENQEVVQEEEMERLSLFLRDFHDGNSKRCQVSFESVIPAIIELKTRLAELNQELKDMEDSKTQLSQSLQALVVAERKALIDAEKIEGCDEEIQKQEGNLMTYYLTERYLALASEQERKQVFLLRDQIAEIKERIFEKRSRVVEEKKRINESKDEITKVRGDVDIAKQEIDNFLSENEELIRNLEKFEETIMQEKVGRIRKRSFPPLSEFQNLESGALAPYIVAIHRASKKVAKRRAEEVSSITPAIEVRSEDFSQSGAIFREGASRDDVHSAVERTPTRRAKIGSPSL